MKINGIEFTIGADPEIFVKKNGKLVSAHGLIKGDKKNPLKVEKGAVQVDGMALEFNIDPAKNEEEFLLNLNTVMATLKDMLPGYTYHDAPVAHFGAAYIDAQPAEAKILGCEPDWNAYTRAVNPIPDAKMPFRSAAGHIHIGWTNDVDPTDPGHMEACFTLTKALDKHLGLLSVLWDEDNDRRKLYGKSGCFRPKPYGMEYRTLSNAWLREDKREKMCKFVYGNTIEAIKNAFHAPEEFDGEFKLNNKTVRSLIDNGDKADVLASLVYTQIKYPKHYGE